MVCPLRCGHLALKRPEVDPRDGVRWDSYECPSCGSFLTTFFMVAFLLAATDQQLDRIRARVRLARAGSPARVGPSLLGWSQGVTDEEMTESA